MIKDYPGAETYAVSIGLEDEWSVDRPVWENIQRHMDELTVTKASEQYPDAPHARNIRRACRLGYIEGARQVGKTWAFAREAFEAWLNEPRYHTPGVKTAHEDK